MTKCPVLVERDYELQGLSAAAASAAAGAPRLVLLTGESGAGKSRLAHELLASLPKGWRLSVDVVPTRRTGPAVVVVEDLHERDAAAVDELGEMIRAAESDARHLLVLATYRLGSHGPGSPMARAVAHLLRAPGASEIRVAPISVKGVEEMARAMRPDAVDDDLVRAAHERTGGNALFLEEILGASGRELPWTITEAVLARMSPLDGPARHLGELLSLARQPLPYPLLVELSAIIEADHDLDASLDALAAAQLVTEHPGLRFSMAHGLLADAISTTLPAGRRRQLHAALAEALDPMGDAEALAVHWHAAGEVDRAAPHAAIAARSRRERRDYVGALDHYRVATRVLPAGALERAELLEAAALTAGAIDAQDEAVSWAEAADLAYAEAGEPWRGAALWLNPALAHVPSSRRLNDQPPGSAVALIREGEKALHDGDPRRALRLARQALVVSEASDRLSDAVAAVALLFGAGATDAAREIQEDLLARAFARGDHLAVADALNELGTMDIALGDWAAGIERYREAHTHALASREAHLWPLTQFRLGAVLALRGDLAEAREMAAGLEALDSPLFGTFAGAIHVMCITQHDPNDLAADAMTRMGTVRQYGTARLVFTYLTSLGWFLLYRGDPEGALEVFGEAAELGGPMLRVDTIERLLGSATAAAELGDEDELRSARATIDDLARSTPGPGAHASSLVAAGLSHRLAARPAEAAAAFRAAAEMWERATRWDRAARAWCDTAQDALAASDRDLGVSAARQAQSLCQAKRFDQLGRRAAALLDQAATAALTAPVDAELALLTPREREAIDLVAACMTNREIAASLFVSEKTVRNILSTAYAKLGVSRRTEVVAMASRLGVSV